RQRIVEGDATAVPASHIVHDDVVGELHRVPTAAIAEGGIAVRVREADHVLTVDLLQGDTTAAAALGLVADDHIGVDHEARTGSVAGANGGRVGLAIQVRGSTAGRIDVGRTLDDDRATVGRNRRIGALVEQEHVVLDVTVVAEAEVTETAAV